MFLESEHRIFQILLLAVGAWGVAVFNGTFWEVASVVLITFASYSLGSKNIKQW